MRSWYPETPHSWEILSPHGRRAYTEPAYRNASSRQEMDNTLEDIPFDDLCARAVGEDREAEAHLFERLRVRFLQVAKRRVREEDREDVVQEGLRIAHSKYRQRTVPDGFLPWSFAILRNVVGNYYKRRSGQPAHVPFEEATGARAPEPPPDLADLDRALRHLARSHPRCGAIFRGILESLDEGGGAREVSGRVLQRAQREEPNLTPDAFYVRLHRCRERLRALLEENPPGGSR